MKKNNKLKVLVCEDDIALNSFLIKRLELLGFEADSALNGTEAIEKIAENEYDFINTDFDMPGFDGLSVAIAASSKKIPVVMLSGSISARPRFLEMPNADLFFFKDQIVDWATYWEMKSLGLKTLEEIQ